MPRYLLPVMFAVLALNLSCQRFRDRFNPVGTLCGVDPATIQSDEVFVKLESPDGAELSAETLLTTRSRFLLPSRSSESLAISPRGCVRVPATAGVLQAFSSAQGWSLSQTVDPNQSPGFLRLPMQTSPRVNAELQCPTQGFYAHQSLPFPLRWTSDGALNATRFEMTAYDEAQQKSVVLFEKPYGQHLTDLPTNLHTEDLPEGQYQLRLTFHISTEGWDVPGSVPTRTESCPLTVLHRRPSVTGLDGYALENRVAVFAKGEILPWKTASEQSELLFCREPRGQDLDDSTLPDNADECRPLLHCQDIKNFQRGGAIVAEEPGVFDYYAYAEDKAGTRSSLSCQTLVVTEKKPELQLLWSVADWNKPSAQMQAPRADVQLRIVARHPQLADASLAARYECKADFVREDQSILSGRTVLCTSGRCRQQSLENYVPCDPDLNLSIVDLWPNMKPEGGVLRIHVKADDRAGHIEQQMTTLGIQPQRWKPTRWSSTTELEDAINQLLQDREGRIFAINPSQIQMREQAQESWQKLPKPAGMENGSITRAWFTQEDEFHAEWQTVRENEFRYHVYRMSGTDWQKLPTLDAEELLQCRQPKALGQGGFWCSTTQGLALYEAGAWTMIPYPTQGQGGDCETLPQAQLLLRGQAKTLWLSCNSSLFQKKGSESNWTLVEHALPLVTIAIDAKERVWTVRGTGRDDLLILRTEGGLTQALPRPASFTWIDVRPQDFAMGPASEIILGDAYWDESQSNWQVFPYLLQRPRDQRVTPRFLSRGELVWLTEQGVLHWDGQGLRNWDLAVHGLKMWPDSAHVALEADGSPWMLASPGGSYEFPYQFHLKKWVYFPKPNLNPNSYITGLWVDGQSTPRIYIPNDGLYTLESAGWTRSLRSPGITDESPLESDVFEPTLLSTQGIYRWTPEQNWTRVVRFPEPRYYWGGTRDAKGRFWVYQNSMELGVIEGSSFSTVPLSADAGTDVKGIFASHETIVVATDIGLFSRTEGLSAWNKIGWQEFGLETVDRIRQLDADTYFVSITDDSATIKEFWILDLKTKTKKPFAVPDNTISLGNIRKTSQGDYVVAIKYDVYRTDGITYTKIFSEKDLYSLPKVTGTHLSLWHLQLDASDRVWLDTRFGVIRIDLY